MIVLVCGPDAAIARAAVAELTAANDPNGENTSVFDAKETALPQVATAAGSVGFFGTGRVVVVRDLMTKARGGKTETDEPTAAALDLAPLFAAVPAENLLILVDPGLSVIPTAIKKAAPADARTILGEPPRGRDLIGWITRTAAELDGAIDPAAAKLLAESLYPQTWAAKPTNPRYDRPPDLDLLKARLETLILFAHPEGVDRRHVSELVVGAPNDRIFRFVEAAAAGDLRTAVAELDELLLAGEEPAKLLNQVLGQVELAAVAAAGDQVDPAAIGRQLGLSNPSQMIAIARSRPRGERSGNAPLAAALASDRGMKSGRLRSPREALTDVLVRLAADGRPLADAAALSVSERA